MKYKTVREANKGYTIIGLVIGSFGLFVAILCVFAYKGENNNTNIVMNLILAFIGIGSFVNSWTCNLKRNKMKRHGEKFKARIIGAQCLFNARDEDTFFLLIEFYENGEKKIRYTEGYYGNPNHYLRSAACEVYKWKNKYIETGFDVLDKKEKPYLKQELTSFT